jgi:hypothetical protein
LIASPLLLSIYIVPVIAGTLLVNNVVLPNYEFGYSSIKKSNNEVSVITEESIVLSFVYMMPFNISSSQLF